MHKDATLRHWKRREIFFFPCIKLTQGFFPPTIGHNYWSRSTSQYYFSSRPIQTWSIINININALHECYSTINQSLANLNHRISSLISNQSLIKTSNHRTVSFHRLYRKRLWLDFLPFCSRWVIYKCRRTNLYTLSNSVFLFLFFFVSIRVVTIKASIMA